MAKDTMKLGEGFKTAIISGGTIETKPRHAVIGWGVIVSVLAGIIYWTVGM